MIILIAMAATALFIYVGYYILVFYTACEVYKLLGEDELDNISSSELNNVTDRTLRRIVSNLFRLR